MSAGATFDVRSDSNTASVTASSPASSAAASMARARPAVTSSRRRLACHVTITGTKVSAAVTFESTRVRQTSQYGVSPKRLSSTNAASRNDEKKAAANAATMNALTSSSVPNVSGCRRSSRRHAAPISASDMLLTNQHSTITIGTPPWTSASKCAGSAAAATTHHDRTGSSTSAAKTTEFGGHSTETGFGTNVSARPSRAPR